MKFEIYNHRQWLGITDPGVLVPRLSDILDKSGYTVINFTEHRFTPHGYTCIWLLAESHLALHTFPEDGRSYIELSGCREEMNVAFVDFMRRWEKELEQIPTDQV